MIEDTSLCNIESRSLWDVDEKFIPISTIVCHQVVFMYQSEWYDVGYPVWIVPNRILISRKVTNIIGVCYNCIEIDMYIFPVRIIYGVWKIFDIDQGVGRWLIVE